jgi:FkbM family methyltransferase
MSATSKLGFGLIARGFRAPRLHSWSQLDQWSRLIETLDCLKINVFLDVGANKGFFAKHLRQCGYAGEILSFEPIRSDCEHIRQRARNDPKWKVFNYGLGNEDGDRTFNINLTVGRETVLSSFLPYKDGNSTTTAVQIKRLDSVLPDFIDISKARIFLKMDTQGFDLEVVKGAAKCLDRIVGLQSEIAVIQSYEGMPSYTDSLEYYHSLGFKLIDLFVVARTGEGPVVEYDCLMAKFS